MNKKNKILVLGYFGYANNQLDGQTVKTRNIYELLKQKEIDVNSNVSYFDTHSFRQNKFNVIKMFYSTYMCDILIYIPAHNNLKFFFPFLYFVCKLFNIKIHYIVVGGWLSQFIQDKPLHIKLLSKIEGIYPQTKELCYNLEFKYKFNNVSQLNNFKLQSYFADNLKIQCTKKKLVFMARVHPLKGVEVLFNLANRLNNEKIESVIDIYGPIYEKYKLEFESKLQKNKNVRYLGILQQDQIYKTLIQYDLMLFPTKYYTEGFPGSILDAYIAGLPVISTKWKYAEEFIEDNVGGLITDFDDENDFINKTIDVINSSDRLSFLKLGVSKQALRYSSETAWGLLKKRIFLK